MAVSSSLSTVATIDKILLRAYKKAGLVPIEFEIGGDADWNAKAAHGREILTDIMDGPKINSSIDYFRSFFDLTLTADEQYYNLDADILNVIGDASYIDASNADTKDTTGETIVTQINRHRWNTLSSKSSSGRPSLFLVIREGKTLSVRLWPQPDEAGTIRFDVHSLNVSHETGSDDINLRRYWKDYLVHAVAWQLMIDAKLPLEEQVSVKQEMDSLLIECKKLAEPNVAPVLIHTHSTAWSR